MDIFVSYDKSTLFLGYQNSYVLISIDKTLVITMKSLLSLMGASMVKYTKKMPKYIKIIIVLVKHLIVVAMCCLYWNFFMVPFIFMLGTQI